MGGGGEGMGSRVDSEVGWTRCWRRGVSLGCAYGVWGLVGVMCGGVGFGGGFTQTLTLGFGLGLEGLGGIW